MNAILINFRSILRSANIQSKREPRCYLPIASASSMAPAFVFKNVQFNSQFNTLIAPKLSYRPPRIFSRGDSETKPKQAPFFFLLTETDEMPRARRVPYDRNLLRAICHGKGVLKQNDLG